MEKIDELELKYDIKELFWLKLEDNLYFDDVDFGEPFNFLGGSDKDFLKIIITIEKKYKLDLMSVKNLIGKPMGAIVDIIWDKINVEITKKTIIPIRKTCGRLDLKNKLKNLLMSEFAYDLSKYEDEGEAKVNNVTENLVRLFSSQNNKQQRELLLTFANFKDQWEHDNNNMDSNEIIVNEFVKTFKDNI